MAFLLDTNVVSETRKRIPEASVMAWLQVQNQGDLFVSVLTVGELAKGIARRADRDPDAAAALSHWLTGIETLFADRIIPVDAEIAKKWGNLNRERPLPVIDSLLAATAKVRGLALVTRNVKDVLTTGVEVINPWDTTR